MCGIAGYFGSETSGLDAALAALRHRGPDDRGLWEGTLAGQRAGLAHARLAILDLSPVGRQPMASADGRLRIVFNGEIYNYRAMRAELHRLGHAFASQTDTEVVLAGYRQWGDGVLDRLRGMFALAIFDEGRGRVLIARDRLGIKPLYYQPLPGGVRFASEPKGLLAMLPERPGVDLHALRDYLTYLYVPYPRSIFQGLRQLAPGHSLVVEGGRSRLARWWRLPPAGPPRPRAELVFEVRRRLEEVVELHLVSDVPVGAFLSGGLDSTTLVALAARRGGRPIETFCMTFEPDAGLYDERVYARAVAERYGTVHTEIPVRPDLAELLPRAIRHFDEPFGNPTALLVDLLSEKTREHVTVALAGDGGDELFLGYPRYQGAALSEAWRRLPRRLRALAAVGIAPRIPESTRGRHSLRRAREFLSGSLMPPDEMYAGWVTYFAEAEQRVLLTPDLLAATEGRRPFEHLEEQLEPGERRGLVDRCQAVDLGSFLPGNLLTYSDRMSMAHGLEIRVPFCDHVLVELLASVPAEQKMPRLRTKALLREAVADLLPAAVQRRRKLGFNPPAGIWLNGPLRPMVEDLLAPRRLREQGWLDPVAVQTLLEEHRTGKRDRTWHLWSLLALEVWADVYRSGTAPVPRPSREVEALTDRAPA